MKNDIIENTLRRLTEILDTTDEMEAFLGCQEIVLQANSSVYERAIDHVEMIKHIRQIANAINADNLSEERTCTLTLQVVDDVELLLNSFEELLPLLPISYTQWLRQRDLEVIEF